MGLALDYWRFRRRARRPVAFDALSPDQSRRWSADPAVGEDYYHVQWIACLPEGAFSGETWLIGDQPWPDAPEFMVWGLDARGRARFAWMFHDWPRAWRLQTASLIST